MSVISPEPKILVPGEMNPPLNSTLITDWAGMEKVCSFLERASLYGLDTETNICDIFNERRLRTIQVGDKNEQYVIDLLHFAGSTENLIKYQGDFGAGTNPLSDVAKCLRPYLEGGKKLIVGQNLWFDYVVLKWCLGLEPWNLYSIDLAEKVMLCGWVGFYEKGYFALDDMALKYCKLIIDKSHQSTFDLESPLTQAQVDYAGLDTRLPIAVRMGQLGLLERDGLVRPAQIEMDAIPAFGDLHLNGVKCADDKWLTIVHDIEEEHRKNILRMDVHCIPVVGQKGIPNIDLDALEKRWRELGVDSEEERQLKLDRKSVKDKEKKAAVTVKIEAAKARRTALRNEARQKFYEARKAISDAKKNFDDYQGEAAINYGSKPQMLAVLRKITKLGEKALPDTNDKTLEKLASKHQIIEALRDYRSTEKALDNYGYAWVRSLRHVNEAGKLEPGFVNPYTGRIHAKFNQLGAATGRTSCEKPNLQNLPKEDRYRACFVARPGYKIITADWSGCELRIIAEMSGQQTWVDAFNNDWDLHEVVCEMMHEQDFIDGIVHEAYIVQKLKDGKQVDVEIPPCAYVYGAIDKDTGVHKDHLQCSCPVHKEMRDGIKPMNFGIAYGLTAYGLAPKLHINEEEAQRRIEKYYAANPDVIAMLNRSGIIATSKFEARTLSGRRRGFKRYTYEDAEIAAQAKYGRKPQTKEVVRQLKGMMAGIEREGRNTPIQGLNADMLKVAVGCGFDKNGNPFLWHLAKKYGALLINEVHDEIVYEVPEEYAEEFKAIVQDAMIRAGAEFVSKVTMVSEAKIADRWQK